MQYRKYEFNTQQEWATLKTAHLQFDINNNPKNASVVELGNLIITNATYDAQGNMLTPPTYSTKIAVDILWHEDIIPSAFTQYEVWPSTIGKHTFQGMEGLYFEAYNNR